MTNLTSRIMDYEMGEMSGPDVIRLFSDLVRNGQAWTLQGTYGRTAGMLIKNGALDENGDILVDLDSMEVVQP